jgi:hypothetical protein
MSGQGRRRKSLADTLRAQSDGTALEDASEKVKKLNASESSSSKADTSEQSTENTPIEHPNRTAQLDTPTGQSNRTTLQDSPNKRPVQPDSPTGQSKHASGLSNQTPQLNTPSEHPSIKESQEPQNFLSQESITLKSNSHKQLYDFLTHNPDIVTNYENLQALNGIPKGTIRNALRSFQHKGLIHKENYRENNHKRQGLRIITKHPNWTPQVKTPTGQATWTDQKHSKIDRIYLSSERGGSAEGGETEQAGDPIKHQLLSLSNSDIEYHWPKLAQVGFGSHQVQQIVNELEKTGRSTEYVLRSFDHIEYWLNHGDGRDGQGEPVASKLNYIFKSLAKTGYFSQPSGYISPEELAEEERKKELERIKNKRHERMLLEFEEWKKSLSEEEKDDLLKNRRGPKDKWLWHKFLQLNNYDP